jgi:hypothetical protein
VRLRTDEPRERRVLINILGTTLAMVDQKLDPLGEVLGITGPLSDVRIYLRCGGNSVHKAKEPFVAQPNGSADWDFELIKIISLTASSPAHQARQNGAWTYPDIWAGDSHAFPYPY